MSDINQSTNKAPVFLVIGDRKSGKTSIIANITRKKMDVTPLTFGVGLEFMEVNFKDQILDVSFYETNFQNLNYAERIFANDFGMLSNLTILLVLENKSTQVSFSDFENKFRLVKTFINNVTSGLSEEQSQVLRDKFLEVHGLDQTESFLMIPCAVLMHKFDKYLTSDV